MELTCSQSLPRNTYIAYKISNESYQYVLNCDDSMLYAINGPWINLDGYSAGGILTPYQV